MTPTAAALLGFAAWTILLVMPLGVLRTGLVFAGKRKANEFKASGDDLAGFGEGLKARFGQVEIEKLGCVALFRAR